MFRRRCVAATILGDLEIGRYALVGAGSVMTKSVADNLPHLVHDETKNTQSSEAIGADGSDPSKKYIGLSA